ncbi:MAG: AIM24 family protein [Chloroflexota bacterium]|nr:AIM24 family protein [Chloroflexota bacterium]
MSIPAEADSLQEFVAEHAQKNTGTRWQLENPKALEINLSNETVYLKAGSMIGYYGNIRFESTTGGGGLNRLIKRAMTGEAASLMRAQGSGTLYVADAGKEVSLVTLNNETIFLNGSDMLAYQDGLDWDIVMTRGAGMAAGGLFSLKLSGSGLVAFTTHGRPLVLGVRPDQPLLTDPNATVAWSGNLQPGYRTDVNWKTLIGRSSGETYQLEFRGEGFVVLQPYEEIVLPTNRS